MKDDSSVPQYFGDVDPSAWPGERLGLPETGQFSIARLPRRIGAIAVDWLIASLLAQILVGVIGQEVGVQFVPTATLLIFAVMQILLIPFIGGSIGHRVLGLRVIRLAGGWIGLWRPALRTILLLLVIPVLVWDSDQRGFHDKIAGTALVRA